MDESYRLARELISNRIGMNFDPLAQANGILQIVSTFCMKGIDIRLYKLNSYTTGGYRRLDHTIFPDNDAYSRRLF